jgi:hypothetical protein
MRAVMNCRKGIEGSATSAGGPAVAAHAGEGVHQGDVYPGGAVVIVDKAEGASGPLEQRHRSAWSAEQLLDAPLDPQCPRAKTAIAQARLAQRGKQRCQPAGIGTGKPFCLVAQSLAQGANLISVAARDLGGKLPEVHHWITASAHLRKSER